MGQIEDSNIAGIEPLLAPRELKAALPATDKVRDVVVAGRRAIRDVIQGRDRRRLIVVVGPCSIHDPDAAFDYAERLRKVADETKNELVVVMRTYFEKPRTTVGWKGLINDPRLDESCDIPAGLNIARSVLLRISDIGLFCGTEFLDPIVPQYMGDLVSWAAVGARTTESQTHRQMASGLSMPVGFKNSTDGSLQNALNAMISARAAHAFLGIDANGATSVVKTMGNSDVHIVLRGGGGQSNYHAKDLAHAVEQVAAQGVARGVMIDCSHDNSGKDHTRQAAVFREVASAFIDGQVGLAGLMIESNLKPGKQTWQRGRALSYGVSITDSCIGYEETEEMLREAAQKIARGARPAAALADAGERGDARSGAIG